MRMMRWMACAMLAMGISGGALAQDFDLPPNPDKTFRTSDGQEVRQYVLDVKAVGRRHITVEFTNGERHTYRVPNDFRFNIDGTPTPLSGIYPRQQLRAYFYYDDGEWQLAQPSDFDVMEDETIYIDTVADRAEEYELEPRMDDSSPMMPKTAGTLPLVALIGMLLLAAAGGLRLARTRL